MAVGLVFLALANFFVWREVFSLDSNLHVVFFDVGQGDAIFIETPQGHQVLIDGGPSGEVILDKLFDEMPFWDRTLDLIILTHPDYDHLRGLLDVLDRYKVEKILWTGVLRETKTFEEWLEKLGAEKEEGAEVFIAQKGQVVRAGDSQFYIFHPFESLEGELMEKSSNESSIVLKMAFGQNSFLFTGDITKKQEDAILVRSDFPVGPGAEVLKLPHHGSKTANSRAFLEVISPQIAVISCGKDNSYGHPHQEVLSNLAEFAITYLRTDQVGDVEVIADGNSFFINN